MSLFQSYSIGAWRAVMIAGLVGILVPTTVFAQSGGATGSLDSALVHVSELRESGEFEEARRQLAQLRDEYGDRVEILWRSSLNHVDLAKKTTDEEAVKKHYQDALESADAALEADSTVAHAHLAKAVSEGRIALDAGTRERVQRSRAVKKHSDRAIELDDGIPGAYHTRARWHREVSDLNFFERAIVKTVYGGLPEASYEQSVRDFKRAIELENVRFHHLELAKTYLKMDREEDARRELKTVIELSPKETFAERYKNEAEELLQEVD